MEKDTARPLSIFLGIQEIAGYYVNLEKGLTEIGVKARLVTTRPHPFDYGQAQPNPWPAEIASNGVRGFRKSKGIVLWWYATKFMFGSILTLFWAIPRYNTFVFGWGMSFLPGNIDILILRLCGKKVVSVLGHGSESRPPYMSTPPETLPLPPKRLKGLAGEVRRIARRVRRLERWSTHTIGMLTTAQFFTKKFIDFYYIGLPTSNRVPNPPNADSNIFTILHVPSNMAVKGTEHIRESVTQIMKRHSHVRYIELTGVSHEQVMSAMAEATVVIDWLWSDIPMAVVGTEAASLATPTIISSYAWPQWDSWEKKNPGRRPPAIYATPDSLSQVIEQAIVDIQGTEAVGKAAYEFVTTRWTSAQVATTFVAAVRNNLPEEGYLSPEDVDYLWGAGVSQQDVKQLVGDLVRFHGENSLRWKRGADFYQLKENS
jgi:hypothetical protein